MVISKSLQHRAVAWFHHDLQHPGTKRLEETLHLLMCTNDSPITCQKCHSCWVNKHRQLKHGKLPTKLAITNPWEALCVDLIGPYTLKGKDKTHIDFYMSLTFPGAKGQGSNDTHIQPKQPYFDKSSATVGNIRFSCYPRSQYIIYNNGSEFKLHFETLCHSYGLKRKPTSVRNPQANTILERVRQTIMAMLITADLDMP
eukprot:CCRYP_015302-RA/>CCRYP_015302-RA protein AED:0.42 eAED:0.42 QI:0/0/0/1/0/0/3/0/199